MKALILAAALLVPFAANAQYTQWNGTQTQVGNMSYGNYYGSNGQSMQQTQTQIGNTQYTNQTYNNGQGQMQTRNCTTQQIGNMVTTNCY
jgi:hypothetical protein